MNGGGKTTILNAVKLALYGSRGSYSKKANIGYDEFLRHSIHRGVAASIWRIRCLGFPYYPGRRGTCLPGASRLAAAGSFDSRAGLRLQGRHSGPVRRRPLDGPCGGSDPARRFPSFFFDAEQIRFLADEDTAQASLGGAIKSLLGLDLAERLITDASVLESRFTQQIVAVAEDPEIAGLQAEFGAKENEYRRAKEDRAGSYRPVTAGQERERERGGCVQGHRRQALAGARERSRQALSDLKARRVPSSHNSSSLPQARCLWASSPICWALSRSRTR